MELTTPHAPAVTEKDFDSIYREYYHRCFTFAKSYLHDDAQSKDIASEAMVSLWSALQLEQVTNIGSFLFTLIKHKALNHLRHEQVRVHVHEHILNDMEYDLGFRISTLEACDPTVIFSGEIHDIVSTTLDKLPLQTRRIFQMSRYENQSNKEIAEILNITVKGVDYHISKATKSLRIALKDYLYSLLF